MRPSHRKWNRQWVPGPRARLREDIPVTELLKELWPQHMICGGEIWARPWWAKLAHARGWMTSLEYYAIEEEPTGEMYPGMGLSYEESPLLKLIKRDEAWV